MGKNYPKNNSRNIARIEEIKFLGGKALYVFNIMN